jgi:hypothetical protein
MAAGRSLFISAKESLSGQRVMGSLIPYLLIKCDVKFRKPFNLTAAT